MTKHLEKFHIWEVSDPPYMEKNKLLLQCSQLGQIFRKTPEFWLFAKNESEKGLLFHKKPEKWRSEQDLLLISINNSWHSICYVQLL